MTRGMHSNGRSKHDGKHIRIYWWAFKSPAYRSLSCCARCALDELLFLHDGKNNGAISASVHWLRQRLNAGTDQVRRALAELVDRGFLKVTSKGSFNHKAGARKGEATTWQITMLETPDGEASKDFMRWSGGLDTAAKKQTTVPTSVRHGTDIRYRRANFGAKNGQSRTDVGTVKPDFDHLTVPDAGTSIVNHTGGREAAPPSPAIQSKRPVDKVAPRNCYAGRGSFEKQREQALRKCAELVEPTNGRATCTPEQARDFAQRHGLQPKPSLTMEQQQRRENDARDALLRRAGPPAPRPTSTLNGSTYRA